MAVFLTSLPLPARTGSFGGRHQIFEKMSDKETQDPGVQDNENYMFNSDENMGGTTHLNDPVTEEAEIEKFKAELEEAKDKYLRKVAEFDNFKRRNAKERLELMQTAGRDIITELLDVLDDCDRAEKQIEKSDDPQTIKQGVWLVFNKLRNTLQSKGLKIMETKHQVFNADLHEAITEIPSPTPDLRGKIIDEVSKGYYLNDKIIRHAKVVVGK